MTDSAQTPAKTPSSVDPAENAVEKGVWETPKFEIVMITSAEAAPGFAVDAGSLS